MPPFLVVMTFWGLLFLVLGLFDTWYHGYRNPIEWWYRRINTDRNAGVWYYGTLRGAKRRIRQ